MGTDIICLSVDDFCDMPIRLGLISQLLTALVVILDVRLL